MSPSNAMTALRKRLDDLTDENSHTEAACVMAEAVEGDMARAYALVLNDIADRTSLYGFIDKDDQKLRDAIATKLRATLIRERKI
jgi:hypothetical protein